MSSRARPASMSYGSSGILSIFWPEKDLNFFNPSTCSLYRCRLMGLQQEPRSRSPSGSTGIESLNDAEQDELPLRLKYSNFSASAGAMNTSPALPAPAPRKK